MQIYFNSKSCFVNSAKNTKSKYLSKLKLLPLTPLFILLTPKIYEVFHIFTVCSTEG